MTKQAVLITGAAKRVGREIALHLAARGFDIALHYHTSQAEAEQTAAEIRVLGADCALFQADLAELEKLPGLMAAVHARFPQLAHLVNNASVFEQAGLLESDASLMARTFAVNFYAPVLLTQELARMTTGPASVTNLLDAKVDATQHRYFFYLLSKKTLRDFTHMAAAELAPRVHVHGIYPGKVLPNIDGKGSGGPITGTPQEIAAAVGEVVKGP